MLSFTCLTLNKHVILACLPGNCLLITIVDLFRPAAFTIALTSSTGYRAARDIGHSCFRVGSRSNPRQLRRIGFWPCIPVDKYRRHLWWFGVVSPLFLSVSYASHNRRLPASVNVFFQINQEHRHQESGDESPSNRELARQEHEFQIGSIGCAKRGNPELWLTSFLHRFADSSGILLASLLAMPTEIGLCNAQKARGKLLCSKL